MASAEQLLNAGLGHHRAGDLAGAARCYQLVLERAPNDPRGWHLLGLTHAQAGETDDAMALFTRALAIDATYAEAHYDLAALHLRHGRNAEAAACYRAAVAAGPAAPWRSKAWSEMGAALCRLGDYDAAIAAWREALAIGPGRIDTQYNLACAHHHTGALPDAIAGYRAVLAAQPRHREAQESLRQALLQSAPQSAPEPGE